LFLFSCGNSPGLLWKFKTGGRIYGSPAAAGQLLITGSADSFLYALNSKTGQEVWRKKFDSPFFASPIVRNGAIYIGTGKGDLVAIDPGSGRERWRIPTGDVIEYDACTDEQSLYFGNNGGGFYRVTFDGNILWHKAFKSKFSGTCQVRENLVYTSCWDKNFYALDRNTGETVWKQPSGTLNFSGPTFQGEKVWFISHEHLFCFDALTGTPRFTRETHYLRHLVEWERTLWTVEKGRLCKRDSDGNLIKALDFNSGPFPPMILNAVLMVGDYKNSLYGLTQDMKITWRFKGDEPFSGGVLSDGFYYASNMDGNIYAIRLPK
jgi:outer membrane protein assembly factor BamB